MSISKVDGFIKCFTTLVDRTIPYCFLRAECTPSQSLLTGSHKVWVCCVKDWGGPIFLLHTHIRGIITFQTYLTQYCIYISLNKLHVTYIYIVYKTTVNNPLKCKKQFLRRLLKAGVKKPKCS